MIGLRLDKLQRRVADPRIIQYALNPPCSSIPATHYATLAGDTMRYLLSNGDWFVFTFGWQYIQHKPHCTPVGEIEKPREQVAMVRHSDEYKHVPMDIYSDRKWKGD